MAKGAKRLPWAAPPNTMGKIGNTQGESVVRLPASKLKPKWLMARSMVAWLPAALMRVTGLNQAFLLR
jgi:hypothetical protein